MKTLKISPTCKFQFCLVALLLLARLGVAQDDFRGEADDVSDDEKKVLSSKFKQYETFKLNPADIRNAIRKNKPQKDKPYQFSLTIGGEKHNFFLFENDILADEFVFFQDGKAVEKKPAEVNTYSGYVDNLSTNALRFYVSDTRFSGIYKTDKGLFQFGLISDHGVAEKGNESKKRIVVSSVDDEISALENMTCGNVFTKPFSPSKGKGGRIGSFSLNCKYIKLAIATDYEYSLSQSAMDGQAGISGLKEKIYDMVNKMEFVLYNNNQGVQNSLGISPTVPPIGLRLQLTALATYTNSNDPFNYEGTTNTSNGTTTLTIDGAGALGEFTNNVNNSTIFPGVAKNIAHFLTGKALGATNGGMEGQGTFPQYGQANTSTVCSSPSLATSVSTIKKLRLNNLNNDGIGYSDVWATMLHEMTHTMGATDLTCVNNGTIMCPKRDKILYFNQQSTNEVTTYLGANSSCINDNIARPAYTNNFSLQLNGNNISNGPIMVNGATKTIDIPNDPTIPVTTSTFSATNSAVTVTKINNNRATFNINTAQSFTLNVFAQNTCGYSQWGVIFVYLASGARVGFDVFPNPANEMMNIEPNKSGVEASEKAIGLAKVLVYSENGTLIKEEVPRNNNLITSDLNNGVYYLHIVDVEGNVSKKRIIINRN